MKHIGRPTSSWLTVNCPCRKAAPPPLRKYWKARKAPPTQRQRANDCGEALVDPRPEFRNREAYNRNRIERSRKDRDENDKLFASVIKKPGPARNRSTRKEGADRSIADRLPGNRKTIMYPIRTILGFVWRTEVESGMARRVAIHAMTGTQFRRR